MNLGDLFPNEWKSEYSVRNLKVGAIVKLHVKDTTPPKEKRFIIVGFTENNEIIAALYFNSEINYNVNWSSELRDQHIHFPAQEREYLDKDCYLDCSRLVFKNFDEIYRAVADNPGAFLGEVSQEDWKLIKQIVVDSPTIKGKVKKKYGFYD